MTYTRAWSNLVPPGSRAAKEIDDAMREFRMDLYQRLSTILDPSVTFDTDPWKLKPASVGTDPGGTGISRTLVIGPHEFESENDEDDVLRHQGYIEGDITGDRVFAAFTIPVGYKLTLFEVSYDKGPGSSVTARFGNVNFLTGAFSTLTGDLVRTATGFGLQASGALSFVVGINDWFLIDVFGSGGRWGLRGARIRYDVANLNLGY